MVKKLIIRQIKKKKNVCNNFSLHPSSSCRDISPTVQQTNIAVPLQHGGKFESKVYDFATKTTWLAVDSVICTPQYKIHPSLMFVFLKISAIDMFQPFKHLFCIMTHSCNRTARTLFYRCTKTRSEGSWQCDLHTKIHIICPILMCVFLKIRAIDLFVTVQTSVLCYDIFEKKHTDWLLFDRCKKTWSVKSWESQTVHMNRASGRVCTVPGVLSAIASDICYLLKTSGFTIHSQKNRKSETQSWG